MPPFFFILIALAIPILGYFGWKSEQKRRQGFSTWALGKDWQYDHRTNATLKHRYAFLDRLQIGHRRHASHHLSGTWDGFAATAFCFRYTTGSGKNEHTHSLGVALIHIERTFPELRIYPEGMMARFGQFLGYSDIDFESVEFSNAFTVRSSDKKFAFDFCNTDMMTLFLQDSSTAMELEFDTLALFKDRYLEPSDLDDMFRHLVAMRNCMPGYLFRD